MVAQMLSARDEMNSPILTWSKLVEELVKNIPHDTRDFTKEMIDESDRGLALICSEALSLKLENLFRMRFPVHEKKIVDPLFQVGGPLSSFADRISLAYSVGYIIPNETGVSYFLISQEGHRNQQHSP